MNHTKTMGILVTIAALMLVPQVLAQVEVGFGTPYVSAGNEVNSPGIYFDGGNIIGADGPFMQSIGATSGSGDGDMEQCWVVHSPDGKYYAVSYASLSDSGSYSYSYVLTPTATSAKVTGHVVATDADDIIFGGFAYNGKAFAAVDLAGSNEDKTGAHADKITYDNSLSASSALVSATQTFSATGADDFEVGAFAAKGAFVNDLDEGVPTAGLPDEAYGTDNPDLAAGQFAYISGGDIKSYTSSASVSDTTATASQKADLTKVTPGEESDEAEVNFWGFSWQSNADEKSAAARTSTYIEGADDTPLTSVTYNAVAKSTSAGTASASQDGIKAKGAEDFWAEAYAESGEGFYSEYEENALAYADPKTYYTDADDWNLWAGQEASLDNFGDSGIEVASYKSSASVSTTGATASQTLSTKGTVRDADFWGYGGQYVDDPETESDAWNSLYLDDGKALTYTATTAATSAGAASATQTLTSLTASDLDANVYAQYEVDGTDVLTARQSAAATVVDEDDLFQVKSYTSSASITPTVAKASQSANLPALKGDEYDVAFCGSAGQYDDDEDNMAYSQTAIAAGDAQNVVYSANSDSASTIKASSSQTFSASEVDGIIADSIATYGEFDTIYGDGDNFLDEFFTDGPALAAGQGAMLCGDDVKITSYKSAASVDTKAASASQNIKTTGTLSGAFVGGSIEEDQSDDYVFAAAVTGAVVVDAKDVSYDGKVTSASSATTVGATGTQALVTKSAKAIAQAAVAVNQNEDNLQYAGSLDLAGDVYGPQIVGYEEGESGDVPIYEESDNKVQSYSGSDSVSTTTAVATGKVTTTATNTLNAQGGFLGRVIAGGEGDEIDGGDVLEQLPLTLNPNMEEDNLQTFTQNIIPVANEEVDGVGVVGETLVFAPILSNTDDEYELPLIADRESSLPNKNSLSGTSKVTVTDNNLGTVTSTLAGSWKATVQKDTTPVSADHDIASMERFAYASNNVNEAFSPAAPTYTLGGAATVSYNEKANEATTGFPTAFV